MTQTFYNKITGHGGVFADDANISDWPDFQEDATRATALQVRKQRGALLIESDSMALADRITSDWTTYRQALRDVPAQAGFPTNVTWPTEPD